MNELTNKAKILIVDDEPSVRKALSEKLEREGFSTFTAPDGEEGLEVALSLRPDLILLDILMPKMDGLAMLKRMRQDEWGKTASVVVLTSVDSDQKALEAMNELVYDFLLKKDTKLDELVAIVKEKVGL